jgi:hypothetical protein
MESVSLFDLEMLTRLLATVASSDTRSEAVNAPLLRQLDHLQAIGLQHLEPVPQTSVISPQ